ncbi:hypothetical protein G9A89_000550 [Geosiphon pyriformis]|nr:hypothetical protein G9A89_000550 [Geosiphon pyriformis]
MDTWYQSLAVKPQTFNNFKTEFVRYFSNNNSINKLANLFTTIKQGDTEAVTTYLGCFHRNLRQIQAIQRVRPIHPVDLPTAVTHARDFEAAELEANHIQAINLVMNGSSELDSKLKQFSESINQKLERYLADNRIIYQPPQRHNNSEICRGSQKHVSATTVINKAIFELIAILIATNDQEINTETPITTTNLSTASISTSSLSITATGNLSTAASSNLSAAAPNNLSVSIINPNTAPKLNYDDIRKPKTQNCSKLEIGNGTGATQNPNSQNYLSLLVTPENTTPNNQKLEQTPTSNISPTTIMEDKSLDAIFPFELEKPSTTLLFSGATLEEKPITAMYTDVKIDGHSIKLILNSGSAGSIIT